MGCGMGVMGSMAGVMSADVEDRPTFMEKVGIASNARNLTVDERTRSVDTVIGLGMALAGLKRNPGKHRVMAELERELVPALWKLKAGEQGRFGGRAVTMFTDWMIEQKRFAPEQRPLVEVFAARVIHEWLHEVCPECGGAGVQERSGHLLLRPRGVGARNPRFFSCELCKGSRRALPKPGERTKALGLSMKSYDNEGWARRFSLALVSMDVIARRLNRPLAIRFR